MSQRTQRLLLACLIALAALYVDNSFSGRRLALSQMAIYTVFAFGLAGLQIGETLVRPRQAGVALALVVLHFWLLARLQRLFPLTSSVSVIMGACTEAFLLIFAYARICQSVDPKGSFGLTAAEIERKRIREERLRSTSD